MSPRSELDEKTLEPARDKRSPESLAVPSLTILFDAGDPRRVGDVARLFEVLGGRVCALSRSEPDFVAPGKSAGSPLGDRHVSRRPIRLFRVNDGIRLESPAAIRIDGVGAMERTVSSAEMKRGAVVEIAGRIVLLLQSSGPPIPAAAVPGLVGESDVWRRVRAEVARTAGLAVPVLLRGETGTGKELIARAIANAGPRASAPFVAVNLGALPPSIAASELFGHVAGAFTGAARQRPGFFAQADGGTLFLDEIGAAPLDVQAALLRVLETSEVQPLGDVRATRVDVRVVSATDENLEQATSAGRFREALFHRLSAYSITLPALRERRGDIGLLLLHHLGKELEALDAADRMGDLSWLPAAVVGELARYDWPGNVRQLANVARRIAIAAHAGAHIDDHVLGISIRQDNPVEAPRAPPADQLKLQLETHRWRIGETARALGISRASLYRLIESSPGIRKAKDVPVDELRASHAACGGDLDAMAEQLKVSPRGIKLRLKDLQ